MESPSPLMGEVFPLLLPEPVVYLLLPHPHRFVLRCGASAGLVGCPAPHLLYQAMHKGRALLFRGIPPHLSWLGNPSLPPLWVTPSLPCPRERCTRFSLPPPPHLLNATKLILSVILSGVSNLLAPLMMELLWNYSIFVLSGFLICQSGVPIYWK